MICNSSSKIKIPNAGRFGACSESAMRALSGVTGVAVESADFIGLDEAYGGRRYFEYWR